VEFNLIQVRRKANSTSLVNWSGVAQAARVVDGSTITMPKTAANQPEYPQTAS
jgi:hypothetical protein